MDATEDGLRPVAVSEALAEVLAAYPLPATMIDGDMSLADLAQAFGVSVNRMSQIAANSVPADQWSDAGQFPAVEIGGPGKRYEIRFSHAWAVRRLRESEDEARTRRSRQVIEAAQATFLGLEVEQTAGQGLTPKARRELAEADIVHSKAAMLRRRLVQLDEVKDLLEDVFAIVRDGIETMPDRLERELGLKPEEVTMVQRLGDDMLRAMAERIEDAHLAERDIGDADVPERLLF